MLFRAVISYCLVGLMLFNSGGYYFWHLEQTARIQSFVQQKSLSDIPVSDLKVVKIPATLYTRAAETDLEEINGTVTDNGKTYQFIRRQVKNDTLYFYCVHDRVQDQMNGFLNEYVKTYLADDSDAPTKNGQQKTLKISLLKDFIPTTASVLLVAVLDVDDKAKNTLPCTADTLVSSDFVAYTTPPPELA